MLSVYPDPRWLTKQYLVLGTISLFLALGAGIVHVSVALAVDDVNVGSLSAIVWGVTGGLVLLMWAITVPAVVLWFRNLEYVIEDDKVIIRKGILTKIQQNIPMGMITDFRLQRTLYDRPLDIGSIQIQTAGQSTTATGYEGKLAGLADWAALHEDLRQRIRHLETPAEPAEEGTDIHAILEEVREIRRVLEVGS